jgi:hypothetical protein
VGGGGGGGRGGVGRARRRWEGGGEVERQEVGRDSGDRMDWLRIRTGGRHLWVR